MQTLRELFRIGYGPSSSHTMGPSKACELFLNSYPDLDTVTIILYGSLAATGKGHLTDIAIRKVFGEKTAAIQWKPSEFMIYHPNAMDIIGYNIKKKKIAEWRIYSIGGGAIKIEGFPGSEINIYPFQHMDEILEWTSKTGKSMWEYVLDNEGEEVLNYFDSVWGTMKEAIDCGIENEGVLPGTLGLRRKAASYYIKAVNASSLVQMESYTFAYALAVAEENASGAKIVTAPTCGSSGVIPAVLKILQKLYSFTDKKILHALLTAGLIGNIAKQNAFVSGAQVGCQGEIGVACAMAAGAAAQLLGGTPQQIEYAAEMGLEHHLGLTCDPVQGYVQIPCIERNALAAVRALDCSIYALNSDGHHRISYDEVIKTMKQTGQDLSKSYKETSDGGLALVYNKSEMKENRLKKIQDKTSKRK